MTSNMTQDEIIKLAKAYGFTGGFDADGKLLHDETFVVAVTEAVDREREACAKLCDRLNFIDNGTPAGIRASNRHCAAAIRARGGEA